MPHTPLAAFLADHIQRFGSKAEFARACDLAESQVHRLFSGEKPGILVTLKVARCLGENPVRLLRLADAHDAADLLAHFVPESDRPAALSSARARVLSQRVSKLVERGLGPKLEEALAALELPWQAGRPQFEDTVRSCGAEKGALILSHSGNPWDVTYSLACTPEELDSLRTRPPEGWKRSEAEVRNLKVTLFLYRPSDLKSTQVDVYLRLCGATLAMFLK